MPDLVLPPIVAEFAERLGTAGYREIFREVEPMDCGEVVFRREPVELWLSKDGSQWFLDLMVRGWRDAIPFPGLEGFGVRVTVGESLAPRSNTDAARDYDVPPAVRWLIRQVLKARFAETSKSDRSHHLVFDRDPVTVALNRGPRGWKVNLSVDGEGLELPRFEGFAEV